MKAAKGGKPGARSGRATYTGRGVAAPAGSLHAEWVHNRKEVSMSRHLPIVWAALALACAAPLPAAATSYFYTIHHLANPFFNGGPSFPEFIDFTGLFEGTDSNDDQIISLSEVSLFLVGTRAGSDFNQLFPSVPGSSGPLCIPEPDPALCVTHSHLDRFSYDFLTGAFEAQGINPAYPDGSYIETGKWVGFSGPGGQGVQYGWTPQTYVTVRPVPEPGSWALMAAGLLGLCGGRKALRRCG